MAELATELKELNDKLDATLKGAHDAQQLATEMKGEIDTLRQESVDRAAEAASTAMAEAQELKQKIDAVEKTAEYIEKSIARMGGTGGNENEEMESKAREETARFLRTNQPMSDDVATSVVRALTEKSFHGVDDSRRETEIKALIAGNNPEGGYFIRPERSTQMIQRIFETSPMRSVSNVVTTASDTLEMIIDDNEADTGGWVGEVTARGETGTPKVGILSIPVHEQFAQPKATQKMLDDPGFDIESWLSGKVTRKMTRTENTAFVLGDGSQKPQGILDLPAWAVAGTYQRNAVEQVNSGASGAFTGDGIKKLKNSVIEEYQAGSIFGIRRASFEQIITLKDGNGQYLLDPRSMKEGDTMTLLGKPVIFMNDMPDIAADALAMVYGDFGVGYTIVDRIGFRVIRDNLTAKPNILFYTTKRTGGAVTNFESYKIQKLSA